MASVEDVASVPLFSALDDAQLQELAGWFEVQEVGDGARLVGEGAPGYRFFVLADGAAAVTLKGESVAVLGPGDFFGEMAILGDGRRAATVTSTSPARLLIMFGTEFRRLEAAHPAIATHIVEAVQGRMAELDAASAQPSRRA
jgi:CRP-like cAMP-binding protein